MNSNGHYISTHATAIAPVHQHQHEIDLMIYAVILVVLVSVVSSTVIQIGNAIEKLWAEE